MNDEDDFPPLSDEDIAELQRRIDDLEDPRRYMILSIIGTFKLWHTAKDDTWCNTQEAGTLYKREVHARALMLSMEKDNHVHVVPVVVDDDDKILETGKIK